MEEQLIEIIATLSKIDQKQTDICKELAKLNAHIYGNGRSGIIERLSILEELNAGTCQWISKHEKNVKWWAVITISIVAIIISLFGPICYGG